jgi:hypothetical protein
MIYDLLCPPDIKRAASPSHFYRDRHKELKDFVEYVEAHQNNASKYLDELLKATAEQAKVDAPNKAPISLEWYARQFILAFGSSWEALDKSRPTARALSAWSFWLAVVLALAGILLVPVAQLVGHVRLQDLIPALPGR